MENEEGIIEKPQVKPVGILKQPTNEEIDVLPESISIEEKLKETGVTDEEVHSLKRIVYYTTNVGLPLEDACKLADVDIDHYKELYEKNKIIKKILDKKELEYKKDLLYTLSVKARSGDDKLAQWLLERRFPSEFSNKKSPPSGDEDMLAMAIKFIQKGGDNTPLIQETSGQAFIIKKNGDNVTWKEKLQNILK